MDNDWEISRWATNSLPLSDVMLSRCVTYFSKAITACATRSENLLETWRNSMKCDLRSVNVTTTPCWSLPKIKSTSQSPKRVRCSTISSHSSILFRLGIFPLRSRFPYTYDASSDSVNASTRYNRPVCPRKCIDRSAHDWSQCPCQLAGSQQASKVLCAVAAVGSSS